MDTLLLRERINQTLKLGESQFREFKSAWAGPSENKRPREISSIITDIAENLVAFANADGGELLIGVEDNGEVTGLSKAIDLPELLDVVISRIHKDTPISSPTAKLVNIDGKQILYFSTEKSTTIVHQTSDGKCLQRNDLETRPVSFTSLTFERQEQIGREYDRQFVEKAYVTDLDLDLINEVSSQITNSFSPERFLQYLGLAEFNQANLTLRRAALLLFAKDVSRWHPRCQVRILRVRGNEIKTGKDYNVVEERIASGNILQLRSLAWERLRPYLVETKFVEDAVFQERIMYPEDACREALINAITHRDYSIEGKDIEILIFDDRMEVHSPGGLLSTVELKGLISLKGIHESRNALISRVLRELGYVRELGEGIRRIFALMSEADLVVPEISTTHDQFTISLKYKSIFSEADQHWIEEYRALKPSREEMLIMLLGKDGALLSPEQIYNSLNLVDWDKYRIIIEQMQAKGILYNAKKRGKTGRRSKRLTIRSPEELKASLAEFYDAMQTTPETSILNIDFIKHSLSLLPEGNCYKTNHIEFIKLLKILDLMDETRRPTDQLLNLWNRARLSPQVTHKTALIDGINESKKQGLQEKRETVELRIENLHHRITKEELNQLLSLLGDVNHLAIPIDTKNQTILGFAYVRMATEEQARAVLEKLDGHNLHGLPIRITWSERD